MLCAIAPTPLLLTEGGHWEFIDQVKNAYAKAGAPDHLQVHHYPRYANPAARRNDGRPLPHGLTLREYLERCNVDVPAHCFKGNLAVPWLTRQVLGQAR